MSYQVKVPAVGESITSGTISAWHKKEGDSVVVGDLLFTLETDKVSTEITAQEAGVLKTLVGEGAEVKIGEVVAEILPAPVAPKTAAPKPPEEEKEQLSTKEVTSILVEKKSQIVEKQEISDVAKKEKVAPVLVEPSKSIPEGRVTRKRLTPLRRKIAEQLVSAQQSAAILTTFNECDMEPIMSLRREVQERFQAKYGVKLGLMSFFIKAVVAALQAVPEVNVRLEGEELIQNHYYDIGVAVGTEKGLIVPVVRNADQLSLAEIEQQLLAYATKAREGKIALADLQGGVFTISNGGVYGSLLSTPILNPPQSGILGMHTIQERPVVRNEQIVIRPMMYLAHSYDHRVVDGKQAVTFLLKVKEVVENPLRLLVG
ncbi:MAG: dihydrolipoyllysine-residue succinyltransferase [Chthoniobacterales bacterium]|nr:dihydrolipoyllysine-residue succinyltransferase [Chthoniobacterales bacterium]